MRDQIFESLPEITYAPLGVDVRKACWEYACAQVKAIGASPYNHWDFTLELAAWIAGEHPKYTIEAYPPMTIQVPPDA